MSFLSQLPCYNLQPKVRSSTRPTQTTPTPEAPQPALPKHHRITAISMSWKLTKSFTRSTSTASTLDPNKDNSHVASLSDNGTTASSNPAVALENPSQAPVVETPKQGILVVTMHEACAPHDIPLDGQCGEHYQLYGIDVISYFGALRDQFTSASVLAGPKYMPYALVDFDKVQVFINSIEGTPDNPKWAGSNTQYKFDVSRVSELTAHLFIRNPAAARSFDAKPGKIGGTTQGFNGVGWFNLQHGTGKLQIGVEFVENQASKLSIDDFDLLKVIGKGSFGKMQSPEKLYFVLAFVNGGELFYHLTNERRFDVNRARFYTAELSCALECLHGFNVIYRDLKPENILLDYQGHIALCDFGLCKLEMKDEDRTNTFCGTPEYLAPELLLGQGYNKTVDWWTLGVLSYEMLTGLPPSYNGETNEMYRKILSEPLSSPGNDVVPPAAKDLLTKLLNRNPA
ncbi:serine/threonine-protein kinase gad8 [Metarhizium acridum CQMa 102]|uniref:non-specific serine/threonine protein kinase n=1 Tax=Metarhizium acridum (strain CQMa 102) TaxID=655827 RepID=E9EDH5_METAQ|nr:serine/threonine-protein kinase gad8 [Metarhizium acridum CQMa 102]EFY86039.1 serine/threonine-protein kinase gad8 [Metarhizium acridum CQMa 102]